jgi:protein ImuB
MAVAAADPAALAMGVRSGMKLAQAQAMLPGLHVLHADPEGDRAALDRLAAWCLGFAPLTAPDPPDGIWIDATGSAHLHGGEAALLAVLTERLAQRGIAARAAIADTPGAAHALARFAGPTVSVVPPGGCEAAIDVLPIAALRLGPETVETLHRLGFELIGQLLATPRGPLVRRFGTDVVLRLDQALGRVAETIEPVFPPELPSHRLAFAEPLLTPEAIALVITRLVETVCPVMEAAGRGARQLQLLFERVDGSLQRIDIGTARPSRDGRHLARLLQERIEQVDPGLGIEAMRLIVPLTEKLAYSQPPAGLDQADTIAAEEEIATLVDRLENRLGAGRVYRVIPVESDVPERSVRQVHPLVAPARMGWPPLLPRPTRLFDPPQPVDAMALLPDQPPVAFTWRRRRHRVRRADGPERVFGEWWRRTTEVTAVRDYFAVEDEDGRRFWLFRRGDGANPETGDRQWFLHGLF